MIDEYAYSRNPKRLYRSRNKVIAGVCGGVAERMGWDPTVVRVIFAVLFFTGILSAVLLIYIVLWAITPYAPYRPRHLSPDEERFWTAASDRPAETFSNVRYKFKDLDDRLANMERVVTSEEWRLRRQFKDLEQS